MEKKKILITGHIPDHFITELSKNFDVEVNPADRPMERKEILRAVEDKEGLLSMITDVVDPELLDRAPRLRMIANLGVGYNNIDVPAATARGILV
jgi:glyoxylate reductase